MSKDIVEPAAGEHIMNEGVVAYGHVWIAPDEIASLAGNGMWLQRSKSRGDLTDQVHGTVQTTGDGANLFNHFQCIVQVIYITYPYGAMFGQFINLFLH